MKITYDDTYEKMDENYKVMCVDDQYKDLKQIIPEQGGRIVLDKGYGEYFDSGDKVLFTLSELTNGMSYERFMKKLQEIKK